jgi:FMN phosphatase YigB (HAD superfamily)
MGLDWRSVDLAIFDLDGTLYDQKRLRMRIGMELAKDALLKGNSRTIRILRHYRHRREHLAAMECEDFLERQFEDTAQACNCSANDVRAAVSEWMDRRPLRHLFRCRYPGVTELFDALRRSGRQIAVLSDYAAEAKLAALELKVDLTVSASDPDVRRLKPNPAGLRKILDATSTPASRAVMIGDRFERDWVAAVRAGVPALILCPREDARCFTFESYDSKIFDAVRTTARCLPTGRPRQCPSAGKPGANAAKF